MPPPAIELAPGPGCPVRVLPMRRVGLANKIRRYALDEKGHHPVQKGRPPAQGLKRALTDRAEWGRLFGEKVTVRARLLLARSHSFAHRTTRVFYKPVESIIVNYVKVRRSQLCL